MQLQFPELPVFATSRRGESFVELIAALLILELLGAAMLATALNTERLQRHAARGSSEDAARWQTYRAAEAQPSCVMASLPDSVPLQFSATTDRPALLTLVRCGQ